MKFLSLLFLLVFSNIVLAADVVISGVNIERIYAQSNDGSTAHLIKLDKSLASHCSDNRVYIDFEDTMLFSAVLAKHISGQSVDVVYSDNSPSKTARRHASITCKLISIF